MLKWNTTPSLFTLLNQKNTMLRKILEQNWRTQQATPISASEWQILSNIRDGQKTVSDIARSAGITRQGAHKYLVALQKKELLDLTFTPANKRDKCPTLTHLGRSCLEYCYSMEDALEKKIINSIGQQNMDALKKILDSEWIAHDTVNKQ